MKQLLMSTPYNKLQLARSKFKVHCITCKLLVFTSAAKVSLFTVMLFCFLVFCLLFSVFFFTTAAQHEIT